jgi:predicted ATP-binding protein involved in virulence
MKITHFKMTNIGRFSQFDIPFDLALTKGSNVIVLFGNNGAGKTSILQSLATVLSWYVARLRSENGSGSPIAPDTIKNGRSSASIEISVLDSYAQKKGTNAGAESGIFHWSLARARIGHKAHQNSDLVGLKALAQFYRECLTSDAETSLPLVAYYPVERVVLDIPLKIRGKHNFQQIDGYDNSLTQGVDFRRFFEWFRDREDAENESGVSDDFLAMVSDMLGQESELWLALSKRHASSRDRQLTAVRSAIMVFMPGFTKLRIQRKPRLHMSISKGNETLNVAQLSQGEKSLMALVGDIARRLATMNPTLENPLHGDGVVLIDEVDLHLHPQWQSTLIKRLRDTFPNVQFVLTTHSPLVLAQLNEGEAYKLEQDEQGNMQAKMVVAPNKAALVDILNDAFDVDVNAMKREQMSPEQQTAAKSRLLSLIKGGNEK